MLIVISPAKTLDYSPQDYTDQYSQPVLLEHSSKLIDSLKKKSPKKIKELMSVSDNIAQLNYERYQDFSLPFNTKNAKQALLAFKGDVYLGFELDKYKQKDFDFAQSHLRILSGLYGVLRPLDLMQPYRLEMGTKLKTRRGPNLYKFWGARITEQVNQALAESKDDLIINLASNEYFKSLQTKALNARILTPVFKDNKNGTLKVISFLAKKARGEMANYIIKKKLKNPEALKKYTVGGYAYDDNLSTEDQWVFTR